MEYDYWADIPKGRENAVSYYHLMNIWGMTKRSVRYKLHQLSKQDNGDGFVLIRSSNWCGFYKTDDLEEIKAYRQEVLNRARHTFAPFRKIDRILGHDENQLVIEL